MSIIEKTRDRLGITVTALAKRMKVSRPQIYNWINRTSVPNAIQVKELSNILGITVESIVNDFVDNEDTFVCPVAACNTITKTSDGIQARFDHNKLVCPGCHDDGN